MVFWDLSLFCERDRETETEYRESWDSESSRVEVILARTDGGRMSSFVFRFHWL